MFDIDHIQTTHEMFYELVITKSMNYRPAVLYSIEVDNLKKGDIISVTSGYEVTNKKDYTLMIASNISISPYQAQPYGEIIDESRGYNVTKIMHHGTVIHARQFKLEKDYPGRYFINTVLWSASSDANKNEGDSLHIEKGYGHLDVMVYKNIS